MLLFFLSSNFSSIIPVTSLVIFYVEILKVVKLAPQIFCYRIQMIHSLNHQTEIGNLALLFHISVPTSTRGTYSDGLDSLNCYKTINVLIEYM